jgi:predicted phage terminase large subunit-like protein
MKINEKEVLRSIVKESFYEFLKEFWPVIIHETPVFNWHIKYLCDEMQTVAERVFNGQPRLYDLIINVPPGSTKSTICSQMFPAWVWTRMASAKFICVSYSHLIALKDAVRMRDIVESDLYIEMFPDIGLREDENTKGYFVNANTGVRLSAGVGGTVTGAHAHFLLIDDPINPSEALSEAKLKNVNDFMEVTLPTRKSDKLVTPTIIIQQRLHQADPSGEAVNNPNKKIKHICLPGELTVDVSPKELAACYNKEGLLDPVRLPREVLNELRTDLGEYGYAAQILQSPVPLGGGMFKVDNLVITDTPPTSIYRVVRSWDKAATAGGGCYSAGVKMAIDREGRFWVLDVVRGQWSATERERIIRRIASTDGDGIAILLEIEGGSGGKESAEETIRNLAGYMVYAYHPTGDKEARAYAFSSQVGSGNVSVLNRTWTKAYIEELRFFPHSKYKDQVDASAAAFNRIARKKKRVGGLKLY